MHKPAPKYIYGKSTPGALTNGEFITRTTKPRCLGQIIQEGELTRVEIIQRWEEMDEDKAKKIALEMKDWYYNSYVKSGS